MKKNSLRFSALVLACVPLLLGTTTLVNAETTSNSSTVETTSTTNVSDISKNTEKNNATKESTKDKSTKNFKLKLKDSPIKTKVGKSGQINLGKLKNKELTGIFEVIEPEDKEKIVEIKPDGTWTALAAGTVNDVKLFFIPDAATKKVLAEEYNGQPIADKIPVEEVSFVIDKKDGGKDDGKDDTKNPVNLKLDLKTEKVTTEKGNLAVYYNGTKLKAKFKTNSTEKMNLVDDGSFTIPTKNTEAKFTEKVTFTLEDDDTLKKVTTEEAKKGKINLEYTQDATVERTIEKSEKIIEIPLINKEIKTNVGGTGVLDVISEFEGVKLKEEKEGKTVLKGTFTGKFLEKDADKFITIDEKGNWKAIQGVQKGSTITPEFKFDKSVEDAFKEKYPNNTIKLQIKSIPIEVDPGSSGNNGSGSGNNNGGKTAKDYVPVNKLPQTGEEKMRFGAIIGVVIIVIAGIIFFMKKKKGSDDDTEA
ncbi:MULTISPECIES: LPXTG cell wall anchor domain-containing protein [Vagococcus]|uniref:Gram-positive cocci surface proteins LPxTG domain-containing protein n=1 Tax=Vagococcus fluvialis bH819 TaxID=1255619 RepID=A0A1X6WQQ4_9ENTE|nr:MULTISPECIES: LPXTG cell wall anchor domain-containing protein [Vagococcus]SLM86620.1 hypothetical protein FM121_11035 [Vagococcus fluvialis bH819]HCM90828.1 LPXTG cell wall anchor domain-containing protein [Vagococcus sp.]